MYLARAGGAAKDLEQGDIVTKLRRPLIPAPRNILKLQKPRNFGGAVQAKPDEIAGDLNLLRGVNPIEEVEFALVVSNSCDNAGGAPILFAPIRPYEFLESSTTASERWREISEAATGTGSPKLFYMPASPQHGLARSEALLAELFPVEQSYVDLCLQHAGTRRLCGLKPAAVRHLQWQIALMFSRDPREDHEWPSEEDLRLKYEWLEDELAKSATPRYKEYEAERDRLKARLGLVTNEPTAQRTSGPIVFVDASNSAADDDDING